MISLFHDFEAESQPQNPEFRNIPENFHPCYSAVPFLHLVITD